MDTINENVDRLQENRGSIFEDIQSKQCDDVQSHLLQVYKKKIQVVLKLSKIAVN